MENLGPQEIETALRSKKAVIEGPRINSGARGRRKSELPETQSDNREIKFAWEAVNPRSDMGN
jgi:hypothetical protein